MLEGYFTSQWLVISLITAFLLVFIKILYSLSPDIKKTRPGLGLPGYEILYTDQKSTLNDRQKETVDSSLLVSEKYKIKGKPDYIYSSIFGSLLPVELKSGEIGNNTTPHEGDLLQLAAYFLIIEEVYESKPKNGRLIYSDWMFIIKNNKRLRKKLLSTLTDMRDMLKTGEHEASPGFIKCKSCVCNGTVCEYNDI